MFISFKDCYNLGHLFCLTVLGCHWVQVMSLLLLLLLLHLLLHYWPTSRQDFSAPLRSALLCVLCPL